MAAFFEIARNRRHRGTLSGKHCVTQQPPSLLRHCHRCVFRLSVLHASTFLPCLCSAPITVPHSSYGGSATCTPCPKAMATPRLPQPGMQPSLLYVLNRPDHSVPNHQVFPCRRFITLRATAQRDRSSISFSAVLSGLLPSWVQASPLASRLAENTRQKRVRHPTDWPFTSCCSPPRLAATQLQSVTGCSVDLERTFTSLIQYAPRRTGPGVIRPAYP